MSHLTMEDGNGGGMSDSHGSHGVGEDGGSVDNRASNNNRGVSHSNGGGVDDGADSVANNSGSVGGVGDNAD